MEQIGEQLRHRRMEMGFSVQEMSDKIKISADRLEAIEAGDLEFFASELTYVPYYIRYYSTALHLNFDDYKTELTTSIDGFQKTTAMNVIKDREALNEKILARSATHRGPQKTTDFSIIAFIVIAIVIVASLSVVLVTYIIPGLFNGNSADQNVVDNPNINNPTTPTDPVTPVQTLTVTAVDDLNYTITGYQDNQVIPIEITVNASTWLSVSKSGVVLDDPVSKVYEKSNKVTFSVDAKTGMDLTINFGYLKTNILKIGDQEITIAQNVRDGQVAHLHFVFKGA